MKATWADIHIVRQLGPDEHTLFCKPANMLRPALIVSSADYVWQVSESRAAHIQRVVASAAAGDSPGGDRAWLATLELHVRLLVLLRPTHFSSFAAFVRWQVCPLPACQAPPLTHQSDCHILQASEQSQQMVDARAATITSLQDAGARAGPTQSIQHGTEILCTFFWLLHAVSGKSRSSD